MLLADTAGSGGLDAVVPVLAAGLGGAAALLSSIRLRRANREEEYERLALAARIRTEARAREVLVGEYLRLHPEDEAGGVSRTVEVTPQPEGRAAESEGQPQQRRLVETLGVPVLTGLIAAGAVIGAAVVTRPDSRPDCVTYVAELQKLAASYTAAQVASQAKVLDFGPYERDCGRASLILPTLVDPQGN